MKNRKFWWMIAIVCIFICIALATIVLSALSLADVFGENNNVVEVVMIVLGIVSCCCGLGALIYEILSDKKKK